MHACNITWTACDVSCRLVGPTGAPNVARQLMKLRLSAVWVLMVAFAGPVPVPGGMEGEYSIKCALGTTDAIIT